MSYSLPGPNGKYRSGLNGVTTLKNALSTYDDHHFVLDTQHDMFICENGIDCANNLYLAMPWSLELDKSSCHEIIATMFSPQKYYYNANGSWYLCHSKLENDRGIIIRAVFVSDNKEPSESRDNVIYEFQIHVMKPVPHECPSFRI
tara:strand:- start:108 stop:545 length:438 start_codon:yes stop_codon:yes gene_type:complete